MTPVRTLLLLACAFPLFLIGCNSTPPDETGTDDSTTGSNENAHAHDHGDELSWVREELNHEGYLINLGHHGPHADAGHALELAATVTKDGEVVDTAKVFTIEFGQNGPVGQEQQMTFEPATDDEPAHYAQTEITPADDAEKITVQYRIEIPDTVADFTERVILTVEQH